MLLFGVTGKSTEAPKMPPKHSVMEWWKALLLLSKFQGWAPSHATQKKEVGTIIVIAF